MLNAHASALAEASFSGCAIAGSGDLESVAVIPPSSFIHHHQKMTK
jgi:hypothetical protein